jgi:nitrate reductase (cytochrome), electron transfer subunit
MNRSTGFALVAFALSTAVLVGCASGPPLNSLRGRDVAAADVAPEPKAYPDVAPTSRDVPLIPRTFTGQPPLVPHTIAKYEPITVSSNDCLDCHVSDELNGRKMPRMGDSHFVTLDRTGAGESVVNMARYQCTSCHVQQVDAKPLVENGFVGDRKRP